MSERCFYDILGVQRGADQAAVKSAFRQMAKKCHPDMGGCQEEFKEVNEAYAVLSDPEKRAKYDRFGRAAFNGNGHAGHADFSDIFNDVFGEAFGDFFGRAPGGGRRGPERGADLRYDLEITLEQAFGGVEREISVRTAQPCEPCNGSGSADSSRASETCTTCGGAGQVRAAQGMFRVVRTCPHCGGRGQVIRNPCKACHGRGVAQKERKLAVKIPAGVEDGTRIRLAGEGDSGGRGGPAGDLYIFLSVKPHSMFERDGADLYCRATVPMCKAALGGEIEIPTIDGGPAKVSVPEGAQTGRRIRMKNMGMTSLRGAQRGDLHVELVVETPVNLSAKQRKLLEEFAESCCEKSHPQSEGFFKSVKRFFDAKTDA